MSIEQVQADKAALEAFVQADAYNVMADAHKRKAVAEALYAENLAQEQHFKTAIMSLKFEQEQVTTESMKDALHRNKQLKRPCMTLGIVVMPEQRDDRIVYLAKWSGLVAEGDTPEMACSNFDRMWVGGDDEL